MRTSTPTILAILLHFMNLNQILGQSTLDPANCEPGSGITAFPNCKYLYDTLQICAGPSVAAGAPYIACMCNQALFNSYFDCESETRLCIGSPDEDDSFESGISQWHSICDPRTTFAVTSPVVSSIVVSYQPDWCTTVESACASGTMEDRLCHNSHLSDPKGYQSCACQPKILSLDYTCEYLGNKSCELTTADLTNLVYYPLCSNLLEVLGGDASTATAPATRPATTTAAATSSTPSPSSGLSSASESGTASSSVGRSPAASQPVTQPILPGASPTSSTSAPAKSSGSQSVAKSAANLHSLCWAIALMATAIILS